MIDIDVAAAWPAVLILLVLGPPVAVDAALGAWRLRARRRRERNGK